MGEANNEKREVNVDYVEHFGEAPGEKVGLDKIAEQEVGGFENGKDDGTDERELHRETNIGKRAQHALHREALAIVVDQDLR